MRVFLIRHPKPLIPPGICYGRLDIDCEDPLPIVKKLEDRLPSTTQVYSSPLRRARRLAEALSSEVRIDSRLSEIDFGAWEGKHWDSIDPKLLDAWARDILDFAPPGGESVAQMRARVVDFARELHERNEADVALATHAGVMRVLVGHWCGLAHEKWTRLEFDFGELVVIEAGNPDQAPFLRYLSSEKKYIHNE
jgi:alpha-ribazole phosphatase